MPTVALDLPTRPRWFEEGLILQVEPAAFKSRGPSELAIAGIAARDSERADRPEREFGETREGHGCRWVLQGRCPGTPPFQGIGERASHTHRQDTPLPRSRSRSFWPTGQLARVEQTRSGPVEAIRMRPRPPALYPQTFPIRRRMYTLGTCDYLLSDCVSGPKPTHGPKRMYHAAGNC